MKFDVLYIDPPWPYGKQTTGTNHAEKHYDLMTIEDIYALPIKELVSKKGLVFLWATCPKLHLATKCFEEWGLHYRGVAYDWVKINKKGEIINGQGVPPTYTKPTTEKLLFGSHSDHGRPLPLNLFGQQQVVLHPRGKHSEKPEKFRELIVAQLGDRVSYCELFAREEREGWTCLGNEITGNDIRVDIEKCLALPSLPPQ